MLLRSGQGSSQCAWLGLDLWLNGSRLNSYSLTLTLTLTLTLSLTLTLIGLMAIVYTPTPLCEPPSL